MKKQPSEKTLPTTYNSIPRDDFHNAIVKYSLVKFNKQWQGARTTTIQVYEIFAQGDFELHLSVMYDPTGWNVTKFHFTLRKGPGKGTDAFAWFKVIGFNKDASIGSRENAGMIALFTDASIPKELKWHVDNIDFYAKEIFREAVSYIKT